MDKNFGLTDKEVEESRQKYGSNRLSEQKSEGFFKKLLGNFKDPMILILCVALAVNVAIVIYDLIKEGTAGWFEPIGIAAAVLIATLVSTFSEYRNENAFQKLQEEASRIKCKVYRNGNLTEVSIDDLVVGDCIVLQSGDKVPADCIMIDGTIKVDQSVLNGESKEATKIAVPENYVDKDTEVDFLNEYKIFRGSVVCSGNAVAKVATVGDESVYGKIASELQADDDRDSPLKVKLAKLAKSISKFGYIGGIAIAVAFIFQSFFMHNGFDGGRISEYFSNWENAVTDVVQAIMLAVIIIVMAVPEGLPLMIAIVSAQNMGKMLKDNVLVRKVEGIETAGSINILFSDKTGTITKGNLEAVLYMDGACNEYKTSVDISPELRKLLNLCIKENTSAITTKEGNEVKVMGGNATERAIFGFVAKDENNYGKVVKVASVPFNSANKYSATTIGGDYDITLIKGAPEKILGKCSGYFDKNGKVCKTNSFDSLNARIDALADRAIRVLALAVSNDKLNGENLPSDSWTLVGVIGIRDEIRPESITAINEVHKAGIQVVMITGDRKETAVAIAKEAGVIEKEDAVVLTSSELQAMSDEDVKKVLPDIRVIARALPSDKSRLVKLAQELNLVVGMTGDGVNDSPALKKADVGFAMGSGTDVAKEASDIVILNDNFSSIAKAILYGRTIFNSIRKFIVFQLTVNVAAVLISLVVPLVSNGDIVNPLSVTQILWVNLIMDTLAALAFGGEPPISDYMKELPKRRDENIVSKNMWCSIITCAAYSFVLSMIFLYVPAFKDFFGEGAVFGATGNRLLTGYFTLFVMTAVFNAFNARTEKLNLFYNIKGNKGFWKILLLIVVVQVVLVYLGSQVFDCYGLTFVQWLVIIAMSIGIIPFDLLRKYIMNVMANKEKQQKA